MQVVLGLPPFLALPALISPLHLARRAVSDCRTVFLFPVVFPFFEIIGFHSPVPPWSYWSVKFPYPSPSLILWFFSLLMVFCPFVPWVTSRTRWLAGRQTYPSSSNRGVIPRKTQVKQSSFPPFSQLVHSFVRPKLRYNAFLDGVCAEFFFCRSSLSKQISRRPLTSATSNSLRHPGGFAAMALSSTH